MTYRTVPFLTGTASLSGMLQEKVAEWSRPLRRRPPYRDGLRRPPRCKDAVRVWGMDIWSPTGLAASLSSCSETGCALRQLSSGLPREERPRVGLAGEARCSDVGRKAGSRGILFLLRGLWLDRSHVRRPSACGHPS